jgi:hypothetical protein
MVAARAGRGVGSEEELTRLQPIRGSGSLGDAKGRRPLPLDPPLCVWESVKFQLTLKKYCESLEEDKIVFVYLSAK